MPSRPQVVAAIPNYNMGEHLSRLLPQMLTQGYDHVFVLDDASTDDSVDVVAGFAGDVTMVRSAQNRGAGANRNQIIDHVDDATLIHFVDADMDVVSRETASLAADLMQFYQPRGIGALGGLVRRADGSQDPFNYGPVFSLRGNLTSIPWMLDGVRDVAAVRAVATKVPLPGTRHWPNIFAEPTPTPTYWLHEGNLVIGAGAFKAIGGYDARIRSHEAQDLAIRLDRIGVGRQFDPRIELIHHYIDVRGKSRRRYEREAAYYLIRKHGLVRFLTA